MNQWVALAVAVLFLAVSVAAAVIVGGVTARRDTQIPLARPRHYKPGWQPWQDHDE